MTGDAFSMVNAWDAIKDTALWWSPVVAGFIGAVGVHLLTQSREQAAWIRNCEKEEWKELVTAMTTAEVSLIGVATAAKNNVLTLELLDEYQRVAMDAFRTALDRIYISESLANYGLANRWGSVQTLFLEDHNADAACAQYASIKATIVALATRQNKKTTIQRLQFWKD
jgi:hypothetical protein